MEIGGVLMQGTPLHFSGVGGCLKKGLGGLCHYNYRD